MSELPAVLAESFARNGRVNAALLAHLTEPDLDLWDQSGGWTVGQHLGHLAGFRKGWLSEISPRHAEELRYIVSASQATGAFWLSTRDLSEIAAAFTAGDAAALGAVQDALATGRSFEGVYESHPAHFLQHILVHDAHHRGQVMTLLRRGGRSKEQMDELDDVTWTVWKE
jgi:uncharacterized damage-inducible protein DinB